VLGNWPALFTVCGWLLLSGVNCSPELVNFILIVPLEIIRIFVNYSGLTTSLHNETYL
jgi:hypothetical protein